MPSGFHLVETSGLTAQVCFPAVRRKIDRQAGFGPSYVHPLTFWRSVEDSAERASEHGPMERVPAGRSALGISYGPTRALA